MHAQVLIVEFQESFSALRDEDCKPDGSSGGREAVSPLDATPTTGDAIGAMSRSQVSRRLRPRVQELLGLIGDDTTGRL